MSQRDSFPKELSEVRRFEQEKWEDYYSEALQGEGQEHDKTLWWRVSDDNTFQIIRALFDHNRHAVRILEAACGSGGSSFLLCDHVPVRNLVLLDISKAALRFARTLQPKNLDVPTEYVRGDIFALPFQDGCFDLVWNVGTIEHYGPEGIRNIIRETARITAPEGWLVLGIPNRWSLAVLKAYLLGTAFGRTVLAKIPGYRFDTEILYRNRDIEDLLREELGEVRTAYAGKLSVGLRPGVVGSMDPADPATVSFFVPCFLLCSADMNHGSAHYSEAMNRNVRTNHTSLVSLAVQCEDFWERQGAIRQASFPLCHNDPTVLFVNAGITPFKAAMLAGQDLPTTAVVQNCFRAYWEQEARLQFHMLTVVGQFAQLPSITSATFEMLYQLGYRKAQLSVVADERDSDLIQTLQPHLARGKLNQQVGNTDSFWTRWTFGEHDQLIGRGVTFVSTSGPRHYALGNIIVVRHVGSGKEYLDMGFGIERLGEGLGIEDRDVHNALNSIIASGVPESAARRCIYYLEPAIMLLGEGLHPSAKKQGYVLRKLLRSVFDLLHGSADTLQVIAEVCALREPFPQRRQRVMGVIEAEAARYQVGLRASWQHALTFVTRNRTLPEHQLRQYLRETLGLPPRDIDELLSEERLR